MEIVLLGRSSRRVVIAGYHNSLETAKWITRPHLMQCNAQYKYSMHLHTYMANKEEDIGHYRPEKARHIVCPII